MCVHFQIKAAALALLVCVEAALGQQAVSGTAQFDPITPAITGDGMARAQVDPAIEQARLQRAALPPVSVGVDANGSAVADTESTSSDDDSFGAQMILKAQERQPTFVVSGSAGVVYTNNVALTRRDTHDDVFAVGDVAVTWMPRLAQQIETSVGFHASIFRYDDTSALDFQNVGFGAGIAWRPANLHGISVFARYDLTELFGRDGHQILLDNALTFGAQKSFIFGRSHALITGATATLSIADPAPAQRQQLGAFFGYHLQLTRKLDSDLLYRPAVHSYMGAGRVDFNQIISWSLRYRLTSWADFTASWSYGVNRSDSAAFEYDVFTTGVTAGVNTRF